MERYSRQILFSPIGEEGQQTIRHKHVLVVGAGALGSANADMLVRAGVGRLTIVDRDYVDWTNLQRQTLYSEEDAEKGWPKAIAAKRRLSSVNRDVHVEALVMDVQDESFASLFEQQIDIIIDGTDNFETRFLLNDLSQKYRIPWIYGACVGSYGLSFTIIPEQTACFRCFINHLPSYHFTCDNIGIVSPAVQMVASYQTAEALKILVGDVAAVRRSLVMFDVWRNEHRFLRVDQLKTEHCPSCGSNRTYPALQSEKAKMSVLCGRDTVQIRHVHPFHITKMMEQMRASGQHVQGNEYLLITQLEGHRVVLFADGRMLIHGTKDVTFARSLYQKYFS
ncbi:MULTISPECIES: ThiF family adenylyltransferase [unclassified Anoxybacillus]|uniref:ThiF family adenylyltransferase n=1 Tax=unclassified Anoxybacillus TaxID=2639704 RepID=UPI001C63D07B|nr:ThiF family adenylyltransferase [Anoxybacillus sp. ST4]MBW7649682.1 ThiF family adenylyltransferase [Anoxybacillus sp. ST4]